MNLSRSALDQPVWLRAVSLVVAVVVSRSRHTAAPCTSLLASALLILVLVLVTLGQRLKDVPSMFHLGLKPSAQSSLGRRARLWMVRLVLRDLVPRDLP